MTGFDRIKPPSRGFPERPNPGRPEDANGRAALFSVGARSGRRLAVRCSRCRTVTALDARTALRAAFPLCIVAPWRRAVFAACPGCRRRSWLRLGSVKDLGA